MHPIDDTALPLQPFYSRFDVANRLLFTGHSHQAWPDVAFDGVREYMNLVAGKVDKKWPHAFEKTEYLRAYLRDYYDDPHGKYCLEQNTHILLVSWLSSLDLKNKPKILTTAGEFHSMYRQLRRLEEIGLEVLYLPSGDDDLLMQAIREHLDERTAAIMLSRVYFETAAVNTRLPDIARFAKESDVPILIDDYHGTNVVPLSLRESGMEHVYLLTGGYKYLQWGEGNCFLRYPPECSLKPVVTGWFAAFEQLDQPRGNRPVRFDDGEQKFATATYDPVSQFRAAAVVRFFREQKLTPEPLEKQYSAQLSLLRSLFDDKKTGTGITGIELANRRPVEKCGGFLALRSPHARRLQAMLRQKDIFTDARGDILRIGPAPYTTSAQCKEVIRALFSCLSSAPFSGV